MKKELLIKIVLTIIALISILIASRWYLKKTPTNEGTCTIIVINEKGEEIINQVLTIERHSLYQLLKTNFNIQTKENVLLGEFILDINNVIPNQDNYFIALYINEKFATKGVSNTYPQDGDIVKLIVQPK